MANGIPIYASDCNDFSGNGLGLLTPNYCKISWEENGPYEVTLEHSMSGDTRWQVIACGCWLKVETPVRESPSYEYEVGGGTAVTRTMSIYKVQTSSGARLNMRQKPSTDSKILGAYKPGTEVVKLSESGSWMQVSIRNGGATGWMSKSFLTFVRDITETIGTEQPTEKKSVSVAVSRTQLFRIYSVEMDSEAMTVTAMARQAFYDMMLNPHNGDYSPENAPAEQVINELWNNRFAPAGDFELHNQIRTGTVTGTYDWMSFPAAMLDGDESVLAQTNGTLFLDNFDVWLLPRQERKTQITIRRGKNLKSVKVTYDTSATVNCIIPRGQNGNGDPLYIDGMKRMSPDYKEGDELRVQMIDYSDVRVGDGDGQFRNDAAARAELVSRADKEFSEKGLHLPSYAMEVDVLSFENVEEYAEYAKLQTIHPEDTVRVIDELLGVSADIRVTSYEWDAIALLYTRIGLGSAVATNATVYGSGIATGSVSGSKLQSGTVGGEKIRSQSIDYAKITNAAIENLQAGTITAGAAIIGRAEIAELKADFLEAVKAHIHEANIDVAKIDDLTAALANITKLYADDIIAKQITTDRLTASLADIVQLHADQLNAGAIETDRLSAVLAKAVTLAATTADIELADIKNLLVKALVVETVTADLVNIRNLIVTDANLLNATISNLVIKGTDDTYWQVHVDSDGKLTVTPAEPTESAYQSTYGGTAIQGMNGDIAGENAVFKTITAAAIEAGSITAMQATIASATIPELQATAIRAIGERLDLSANETIQMVVGQLDTVADQAEVDAKAAAADAKRDVIDYVDGKDAAIGQTIDAAKAESAEKLDAAMQAAYSRIVQEKESIRAEINAAGIASYMDFDDDGLRVGKDGQTYRTLTNNFGFHIEQVVDGEASVITSMAKRAVYAEAFRPGTVSNNGAGVTSSGRVAMRAAPDGGIMFVVEED